MFNTKFSSSDDRFGSQFDGYEVIKGEDGFSPLVEISDIENGHRVQVIDVNGGKYFDVLNGRDGREGVDGRDGKDGAPGKDGVDGRDGKDGKDGYTPVKGVDYFDGKDGKDGKDGAPGQDGKDAEISPTDTLEVAQIITRDLNGHIETTLGPALLSMYSSNVVQRAVLTPIELTLDAGSGDDKPEVQLISPMTNTKATLNSESLRLSRDDDGHDSTAILDKYHLQIGDTITHTELRPTLFKIQGGSVDEVEINLSGSKEHQLPTTKITNYGMWLYEDINDDSWKRASFTPNEITMDFEATQLRLNPYELYLNGGSSHQPYINLIGWGEGHETKTTITNGFSSFWGGLEVIDKEGNTSVIYPTYVATDEGYFGKEDRVYISTDGIVISQNSNHTAELSVTDPEEGIRSFITPYSVCSKEATFGEDDNISLDAYGIVISNSSGYGVALRLQDYGDNAVSSLSPRELSIGQDDVVTIGVTIEERGYINCFGNVRALDYQDMDGTSLITRLDSLDSSLGDIDTALDAILAKHVSVLGGGV